MIIGRMMMDARCYVLFGLLPVSAPQMSTDPTMLRQLTAPIIAITMADSPRRDSLFPQHDVNVTPTKQNDAFLTASNLLSPPVRRCRSAMTSASVDSPSRPRTPAVPTVVQGSDGLVRVYNSRNRTSAVSSDLFSRSRDKKVSEEHLL